MYDTAKLCKILQIHQYFCKNLQIYVCIMFVQCLTTHVLLLYKPDFFFFFSCTGNIVTVEYRQPFLKNLSQCIVLVNSENENIL